MTVKIMILWVKYMNKYININTIKQLSRKIITKKK